MVHDGPKFDKIYVANPGIRKTNTYQNRHQICRLRIIFWLNKHIHSSLWFEAHLCHIWCHHTYLNSLIMSHLPTPLNFASEKHNQN